MDREEVPGVTTHSFNTSSPPRLFLAGPSTLPRLQKLHLSVSFPQMTNPDVYLHEALQQLFKGCLDRPNL